MNEELVRELVELQREQNALLKKHLWRLRFSLLTLLLLTTASAVCLGIIMVRLRNQSPPGGVITLSAPTWTGSSGTPTATLRLQTTPTLPTLNSAPDSPFKEFK